MFRDYLKDCFRGVHSNEIKLGIGPELGIVTVLYSEIFKSMPLHKLPFEKNECI